MDNYTLSGNLMTLSEVATYLKVAEKTILRMIQKNEIPCVKIASQWRFDRGIIDSWILDKMNPSSSDELTKLISEDMDNVPLSRLVSENLVIHKIKPGTREEVLTQLSRPLLKTGFIKDIDSFVEKLIARENMMPTTLGHGIAMPHVRNPRENISSKPAIVIGICREGTNFGDDDEEPVKFFFLIYTNSEIAHLRIIGKLNNFLKKFCNFNDFLTSESAEDVLRVLIKYEKTDINLSVK